MKLSMGNAAWPIGVTADTMHGSEDKPSAPNVAHGLGDDTTRKWVQSIKRMITFAQVRWPPSDISKIVG
jgi:pre-mRNA-splicing factor 18